MARQLTYRGFTITRVPVQKNGFVFGRMYHIVHNGQWIERKTALELKRIIDRIIDKR